MGTEENEDQSGIPFEVLKVQTIRWIRLSKTSFGPTLKNIQTTRLVRGDFPEEPLYYIKHDGIIHELDELPHCWTIDY